MQGVANTMEGVATSHSIIAASYIMLQHEAGNATVVHSAYKPALARLGAPRTLRHHRSAALHFGVYTERPAAARKHADALMRLGADTQPA